MPTNDLDKWQRLDQNMVKVQKRFLGTMRDKEMAKTISQNARKNARPKWDWSSGEPRKFDPGQTPAPSPYAVSNKVQGQIASRLGPDVAKRVYNIARKASGLPKIPGVVGDVSTAYDFAKGVQQGRAMAEKRAPTSATFAGKPYKRRGR